MMRVVVAGLALGLWTVAALPGGAPAAALSADDGARLKAALEAVDQGNWRHAGRVGRAIVDPLAAKVLAWARFTGSDPGARFEEVARFIDGNPDWPRQRALQRRAEEAMTAETPDDAVLAWFGARLPLSGDGMARLAAALLAAGDEADAAPLIKDAWIDGNFTKRRERAFYKRYRRYLTLDDHWRRLDRLLWDGRYWPARRMLWKVKPDRRALATARLMLRHERGNVDSAIAKVPDALRGDPGLVYERLRWRRRKGKYDSAKELLDHPPDDLVRPERWWRERSFLARRFVQTGHMSAAYRIAEDHGLADGADFAEAEWLAGWIALRFLGDARLAQAHFGNMYRAVRFPVSRARGAYWMARALEAAGEPGGAESWHGLAAHYPTTYYGQLALSSARPDANIALASDFEADADEREAFDGNDLVRVVRILHQVGDDDRLRPFISRLAEMAATPAWWYLTAELANASGRPDLALLTTKRAAREGWKFPDFQFPTLVLPRMHVGGEAAAPEAPLVLAVIRQESAFNVKAKSHANAQGLMQLLPRTAYRVAKRLNVPFSRRRLTSDGGYNLILGRAYLAEVLGQFEGSYVLGLAAYNAGPARVRKWLRANGDPRDRDVDSIDWVEMIPFRETRNYVQRVLENLQVYRQRLAETEVALGLENDLHR